jgi:hypothetical protein
MNIFRKILLINIIVACSASVYCQETLSVFEVIKQNRLQALFEEIETGSFEEIWGISLDDMGNEIALLNVLFYEESNAEQRAEMIKKHIGEIKLWASSNIFNPDVNANIIMNHTRGVNEIVIYGGYVVLADYIARYYAYNQYCQINRMDNMQSELFLPALQNIVKQLWIIKNTSNEYKQLSDFDRIYLELDRQSELMKNKGNVRYSLWDYYQTNFMTLMLYAYAHEISHIALYQDDPHDNLLDNNTIEIDVDISVARFLFTRIQGKWGVTDNDRKLEATIEPVLLLLELLADVYPDLQERVINFMRHYLWTQSFYANIEIRGSS